MLESRGKGSVQVNGKTIKKNTSCILNSGDGLAFGLVGNHAYVSLELLSRFLLCLVIFLIFFGVLSSSVLSFLWLHDL